MEIKTESNKPIAKPIANKLPEVSESDIINELLDNLNEATAQVKFYKERLEKREQEFLLQQIKEIDPSVNSIEEMGKDFEHMLEAGVSVASAYRVVKANADDKKTPPVMGDFSGAQNEKSDYFTFDQVNAMSKEQIDKNYDKIMKSQGRWKKTKKI